jgi:hypothetical protein
LSRPSLVWKDSLGVLVSFDIAECYRLRHCCA